MEGFLSKKAGQSISRPDGKFYSCISCGLYKHVVTPKMKPFGNCAKKVLILGEAPSIADDTKGKPWSGKDGRFLKATLESLGIDLFEDCICVNSVHCLPTTKDGDEARKPSGTEVNSCRNTTWKIIEEHKPQVIIALGLTALESLIGHRWKKGLATMDKWRGWNIPDQDLQTWICPTFHPSDVIKKGWEEMTTIWESDLKKAFALLDEPFPNFSNLERKVEIIDQEKPITKFIKSLFDADHFAFDYESTGLKPHDTDKHAIVATSFCSSEEKAVVIPNMYTPKQKTLISRLYCSDTKAIAQNMKFEDTWTRNIFGFDIENWDWDTMQASHILDNRAGVTGLKFQAYVQFGIIDYSSGVDQYLKSDKKDGNSVNTIVKAMKNPRIRKQILIYCGIDSLLTYKLAKKQKEEVKKRGLEKQYELMHKGVLAMSRAEQQGMRIDLKYIKKKKKALTNKINQLEEELLQTNFIRHWKRVFGTKFNINSDHQLEHILYKVKKIKPPKETVSGAGSTDEETLLTLDIPELKDLIQVRKYQKLRDTYLENFEREQVNGYMHPFFNLHTVTTYRSSSSNPNFQNIPKRDKESRQLIRRAIYPRPGHQLLEIDFKGIEVSVAACYHKDPTMIAYLLDKTSDMHGDMAQQIFKLKEFNVKEPEHDYIRSATKNGFVFPQFYGDYYSNCAESLRKWAGLPRGKWKMDQGVFLPDNEPISNHLIGKGIKDYKTFEEHLKDVEHDFWNNRFKVYKQWKEKWLKAYQRRGYFDMLTGFRCSGVMGKNKVINYPVQGSAFHCLLWSFIKTDEVMIEEGWDTKLIGQIHDALLFDVNPEELEHVTKVVKEITTVKLAKHWDWIIVPMGVDAELCGVDQSWATKEKYKLP